MMCASVLSASVWAALDMRVFCWMLVCAASEQSEEGTQRNDQASIKEPAVAKELIEVSSCDVRASLRALEHRSWNQSILQVHTRDDARPGSAWVAYECVYVYVDKQE